VADTSFNNSFKQAVGNWLSQRRYGRHDDRRAEMLARVATFPGGTELLQQAADLGCDIVVRRKSEVWVEGTYNNAGEKPVITMANTGNPARMAIALWHELRHMRQDAANPGRKMAYGGRLKDPRTSYLMGVMAEADAFTAETLMALQQRKAGHPEYFDAMFGHYLDDGPHRDIARFMRRHPYNEFKDDATFARALFTHLMTDGLVAYRVQFMAGIARHFAQAENVEQFRAAIAAEKEDGTKSSPALNALYGPKFAFVSPRALVTAFLPAQAIDEKQALEVADKAVDNAATLTEAEFQAAKTDMLARTKDFWFKPLDEPQFLMREEMSARERLRKAALSDKPAPRP
jgi:hypothetical protein